MKMPKKSPQTAQFSPRGRVKLFSSSILVVEAAIATLVLSVFVSSSPKLFTTQAPAPRPQTAVNPDGLLPRAKQRNPDLGLENRPAQAGLRFFSIGTKPMQP